MSSQQLSSADATGRYMDRLTNLMVVNSHRSLVRLDQHGSPFGTSAAVLGAWERQRTADIRKYGLNRYPDFFNTDLLRALAAHHGLSDANYTVLADIGEGANVLAAALLRGSGVEAVEQWPIADSISRPGRAWGAAVRRVRFGPHRHDLAELAAAVGPRTRLVHVQNPHDPTGSSFGRADLERFLDAVWKRNSGAYVWVDQSYAPYSTRGDFPNSFRVIGRDPERSRLIVTRTIGTAGGVAGDPTAYMAASRSLSYKTQGVDIGTFIAGAYGWKNPDCCVGRMGEKAMLALLTAGGDAWVKHVCALNAAARARLVQALRRHRFEVVPSDAELRARARPPAARRRWPGARACGTGRASVRAARLGSGVPRLGPDLGRGRHRYPASRRRASRWCWGGLDVPSEVVELRFAVVRGERRPGRRRSCGDRAAVHSIFAPARTLVAGAAAREPRGAQADPPAADRARGVRRRGREHAARCAGSRLGGCVSPRLLLRPTQRRADALPREPGRPVTWRRLSLPSRCCGWSTTSLFSRVFLAQGRPFRPWHVPWQPAMSPRPWRGKAFPRSAWGKGVRDVCLADRVAADRRRCVCWRCLPLGAGAEAWSS